LLSRKSAGFRFSASWSCRLKREGFHTNHVNPKGWISSCYYVSLPDVVKQNAGQQGWIKFGESNLRLGEQERIARTVQPEEGLLVLFPSYMFHGTVPFESQQARTTIAFDVVPE
jgi:NAD(P)-dependent dehydrogenase (short-subunit alcohol dehydrogenase family)